jgi:hypothetical protein
MALTKNLLLRKLDTGLTYRVLELVSSAETKDPTVTHAYVIDVDSKQAMPELWSRRKTLDDVLTGALAVVPETRNRMRPVSTV